MLSILIHDREDNTVQSQYLLQIHDGTTITQILVEVNKIAKSPANKTRAALNLSLLILESLPA